MKAFAVMNEGHVVIDRDGNCIIVATSLWATKEEAQYAIDRKYPKNMGAWHPKRRWIEKVTVDESVALSNLQHSRPEYAV